MFNKCLKIIKLKGFQELNIFFQNGDKFLSLETLKFEILALFTHLYCSSCLKVMKKCEQKDKYQIYDWNQSINR